MHLTNRPHAGPAEPIQRRPILSWAKLLAEGTHAETQVVLGWLLDTRRLLVSLPPEKSQPWSAQVKLTIASRKISMQDLDTLVGRLNHAATIIPLSRHFLNRLQARLRRPFPKAQSIMLSNEEIADLRLWLLLLAHATSGISMNTIIFRHPTFILWSDSCPSGIGGYSLAGRAWRLLIPLHIPIRQANNINNYLEFLAMIINIWVACLEGPKSPQCLLALGDNTSTIGWVF